MTDGSRTAVFAPIAAGFSAGPPSAISAFIGFPTTGQPTVLADPWGGHW